jgi:hypothetical protein
VGIVERMRLNSEDIFYGKSEIEHGFENTYNKAIDDILKAIKEIK